MEKQYNDMDKFTHKLLQEAGLEKPSMGFTNSVMDVIISQVETQSIYRPLISKKSWGMVAIISLICLIALYFIPTQGGSILESFGISQKLDLSFNLPNKDSLDLSFNLPNLEISRTSIYAIGFMALFLIQIPFLKRYLESENG
jgi:hypothetical protein